MHDALLCGADERRLGFRYGGERLGAVTSLASASSTLRMAERTCERRDLLMTVRRAIWRAAFLADLVLAMDYRIYALL